MTTDIDFVSGLSSFPDIGKELFAYHGLAAAITATATIVVVTAAAANQDDQNNDPQTVVTAKTVTKAAHTYTSFLCSRKSTPRCFLRLSCYIRS